MFFSGAQAVLAARPHFTAAGSAKGFMKES